MKVLLIDNYDSFTFNLYHYVSSLGVTVDVIRNDEITHKQIIKNFQNLNHCLLASQPEQFQVHRKFEQWKLLMNLRQQEERFMLVV